jgi:hypothetical protein
MHCLQVDKLLQQEVRALAQQLQEQQAALQRAQQREVALLLWTSMIFGLVLLMLPRLSSSGTAFRRLVMLISLCNGALGVLINLTVLQSTGLGLALWRVVAGRLHLLGAGPGAQ